MADVDHNVPRFAHGHCVEIDRNLPVGGTVRGFRNELRGKFSHSHAAPAPVVGMNAIVWNCAKHSPIFFFGVWDVLSERGNDTAIGAPGSEMVVNNLCDPATSRMHARDVGRKQEHSLRIATDSFPCFFARSKRQFLNAWTYNFRSVFDKPRHRHLLYEDLFDSVWIRLCLASSTIIALV